MARSMEVLAEMGAHGVAVTDETTGISGMELGIAPRVANEVLAEMGAYGVAVTDETTSRSGMELGIALRVAAAASAGRA